MKQRPITCPFCGAERPNAVILKSHIQRCEAYKAAKTPHEILVEHLVETGNIMDLMSLGTSGPYGFEAIHKKYPFLWEGQEGKVSLESWSAWPGGFTEYP